MSPQDPADDPLEALAISRLDGEIDDQRWAHLVGEHGAPLEQALQQHQRIAQALRGLPRASADPLLAPGILARIPWDSAVPNVPRLASAPATSQSAPPRRWHPARWAAAGVLAACLVLAVHLESPQWLPAQAPVAIRAGPSLPQHPAAEVQEYGATGETVAANDALHGDTPLASTPRPAVVESHASRRVADEAVANEEPARSAQGPAGMPDAPVGADASPPADGGSGAHVGAPPAGALAADDASVRSPVGGVAYESTPAPAPAAIAVNSPQAAPAAAEAVTAPAAARPQAASAPNPAPELALQAAASRPARVAEAPAGPVVDGWRMAIAWEAGGVRTLELTVSRSGEGRALAAESLSVVGYDLQGHRAWSARLHLPAHEILVDDAHPYHATVSLSGAWEAPAGVASVSLVSPYGHSRLLPLPAAIAPVPPPAPLMAPAASTPGR